VHYNSVIIAAIQPLSIIQTIVSKIFGELHH